MMAKINGDQEELTAEDAAIVKGMLARGDTQHNIASYFGVDSRAVSHIKTGKTFTGISAGSLNNLPPPGPYRPDPIYSSFYATIARVNSLWNARNLRDAKALLEAALKSPAMPLARSDIYQSADDIFRDDFGLLKDL